MKHFYNIQAKQFIMSVCMLSLILTISLTAQDDWQEWSPPGTPNARQGHSMVNLPDGRVLLFGGEGAQEDLLNDLYVFNADSWNAITPENSPPPARRDHQSWTRGDAMYIYGGKGEKGELDDMWKYDPGTNSWQQIQLSGPRPSARHGHTATSMADGTVLIFGGTDAKGIPLKDFWKLNVDNTFTKLADAPESYSNHSTELVVNDDWLFVFGKPNTIAMYQISADAWGLASGGPPTGSRCITTQGLNAAGEPVIFIFGGKDINGNESSRVYEYNLYSGELTTRDNIPNTLVNGAVAKISAVPPSVTLSENRKINSIQAYNKTTMLFGGVTNGVVTNNTYLFSTQSRPDTVSAIPTADTVTANSVVFLWNKVLPIQATHYQLQVGGDMEMSVILADTVVTDTTFTLNTLSAGTDYWWRIRAYNSGGWGDYNTPLHFFTYFVTGIEIENNGIPAKFELFRNYPNPFYQSTNITYTLPSSGFVSLSIYSLDGKKVDVLVREFQKADSYSINYNGFNLLPGVYFYNLSIDNKLLKTRKMILLR